MKYLPYVLLIVGAILGRNLFPRTIKVGRDVPVIVTKYDTVKTTFRDTVKLTKFTTDTFNLVIHQTIHDTVVINVTDNRPRLWPIISYIAVNKTTANVRTFDLRSGIGATSEIYTPGPLSALVAADSATPHITFGIYPEYHTSTLSKLLYVAGGYGLCTLSNYASSHLH